jgi:hypothetical protein
MRHAEFCHVSLLARVCGSESPSSDAKKRGGGILGGLVQRFRSSNDAYQSFWEDRAMRQPSVSRVCSAMIAFPSAETLQSSSDELKRIRGRACMPVAIVLAFFPNPASDMLGTGQAGRRQKNQ